MKDNQFTNGTTKLLTLLGRNLDNSPSPATHCSWAQACHFNAHYNALSVESQEEFTALITSLMLSPHFLGANITNPFKTDALKIPGVRIEKAAQSCGAGNTLYRHPDGNSFVWTITNTDLLGCSESITKILSQKSKTTEQITVVLLGAGAMMQTMLVAIENRALTLGLNLNVFIAARRCTPELDRVLKSSTSSTRVSLNFVNLTQHNWPQVVRSAANSGDPLLCINTLPAGTSTEAEKAVLEAIRSLNVEFASAEKFLFCVSYGLRPWHQFARALNWNVENGDLLFESQARASFKLWTGCDAPNLPSALPQL